MSKNLVEYNPRNIDNIKLTYMLDVMDKLEGHVVYAFMHRREKKMYLHITHAGMLGMLRVYRQVLNKEKLEPTLEDYYLEVIHIDDDMVRARQMFVHITDDYESRGYDVMYKKSAGLILRPVVHLETSAALGFGVEDKGYAVVQAIANGFKRTVGIFDTYAEAKAFGKENYNGSPKGLIIADNDLTKQYLSLDTRYYKDL